jgi:energy-converting hydrogenase Eha subunit H
VKVLLMIGLLGIVGLGPFIVMRKPWAVRIWRQFKLVVVVYAIVILVAGLVRLIANWDDFYG